jgi:hypothetical protein
MRAIQMPLDERAKMYLAGDIKGLAEIAAGLSRARDRSERK